MHNGFYQNCTTAKYKLQNPIFAVAVSCFFFFSLLFISSSALIASPAQALEVNGLRFGTYPDKTRMVIDLDQHVDYKVTMLSDPYRLVIDLPPFAWNVNNVTLPQKSNISDIRQGKFKSDVSRIVIDLKKPAMINSVFFLPSGQIKADRLVVDYSHVSYGEFLRNLSKTYGRFVASDLDTAQIGEYAKQDKNNIATPPPTVPFPSSKPISNSSRKPVIVIDAGHGGIDPGAIGANNVYEKTITLATSKELKRQLLNTGRYEVVMTRDSDTYLKLGERVKVARDHNADLFISIHADAIRDNNVRGASLYTLSNKASDAQTAKLAERENKADLIGGIDLSHEDEDVAKILVDLSMRDTMNQSRFFAGKLVTYMEKNNIKLLKTPLRHAGFAVLKAPDIPSVLVEIGFMSNNYEVSMLSKSSYRKKVASALVDGIDKYFSVQLQAMSQ